MHYRHRYHAGNFADVFKHTLLMSLLGALSRKDTPWCFVDTHAGAGRYALGSQSAEATGEWRDGVGRLGDGRGAPAIVQAYLALAHDARRYPGSPAIAASLARPADRVVCCEKVAEVAAELRANVPRAIVHVRDGYEADSLLPPAERRGLVLVDPAFESRTEFDALGDFLKRAVGRFANGTYAAWYPLKNRHAAERFARRAGTGSGRPALVATFDNGAPGEGQMHSCGMLVLNPPFGFDDEARAVLAWLATRLAQGPKPAWSVGEP